ncbi:hypothetical protein SALBM311S_11142 [Streptomyces alboniger]
MSGGARYWNEETQRWEDTDGPDTVSAPVTPPPPARPGFVPGAGAPGADTGSGTGSAGGERAASGEPGAGAVPGSVPVPDSGPGSGAGPAVGGHADGAPSAGAGAAPGDPASGAAASADEAASAAVSASPSETSETSAPDEPLSAPVTPPASPDSVGWPGSGGQSGWHSPVGAGAGAGAGDVAWSPTEVSGGGPALSESGGGGGAWPAAPWPATTWPPAGQPAAPAPARGMSRRLVWSVLIGAAAVGVAVSLVLTQVVSKDDKDEPSVAASGSESSPPTEVSQQSDPSPTATEETAPPSTSAPALPAGYEAYEDQEGFRTARPKGWTRSTRPSQYGIPVVNYRSADGERRLQVYQVSEESPAASFDLYLSDQTPKAAGFEEISLDTLDDGEFTGSRLEYLADRIKGEPDVGTWHVYDERFVAADGSIYAIAAYGPDSDGREDELELLTTALDHFCPPYACDPASID